MIWVGGALLILGWALLFSVVLEVITQSFLIAFIAIVLLITGTVVGFYGIVMSYRAGRR